MYVRAFASKDAQIAERRSCTRCYLHKDVLGGTDIFRAFGRTTGFDHHENILSAQITPISFLDRVPLAIVKVLAALSCFKDSSRVTEEEPGTAPPIVARHVAINTRVPLLSIAPTVHI